MISTPDIKRCTLTENDKYVKLSFIVYKIYYVHHVHYYDGNSISIERIYDLFLHRFILLACDGLWKGFSVDSAVKYIHDIINVRIITSLISEINKNIMHIGNNSSMS